MRISIADPNQLLPVTYYLQVMNDLEQNGVDHAVLRPGADQVVWASFGSVNKYYIFHNGTIAQVEVD